MRIRVKLEYDRPGVYIWTNLINDKVLIGSSIDLQRRKLEYYSRAARGEIGNTYFQRAWDKYGAEKFMFDILEFCEADVRLEHEQSWIDKYQATDERFGYNLIPTRKSQLYGPALSKHQKRGWAKYTPEQRRQLNLHLNNPITKQAALAKSNEVKKLQPWRDAMAPTWNRLLSKWSDPVWRAKVIAAQNAGKARARQAKQLMVIKTRSVKI